MKTPNIATGTSENTFPFKKSWGLGELLYKRKGSPVFSFEKKVLPCVFALQNNLQCCEKTSVWTSVTSESNIFFKVCFWKKGTLTTKSFKQAPFFNKQAHFSRKCGFPLKKSNKMETAGVRESIQVLFKRREISWKIMKMVPPFLLAYGPFSPNKHTFHANVSFLVKRFRTTKFFRPKKQELGFAPTNSWKTWEK